MIIPLVSKKDRTIISFVIIGIVLSSLAWAGDIFSWAWIGNGFIIDIIFAFVAIILTIGTIYLYSYYKENKSKISVNQTTITAENAIFTCFNCGEVMENKADLCPSCGSPKPVCIVCFSPLNEGEKIAKLNCCGNYAHLDHIKNYIEIKDRCPKCQKEITEKDLEEIILNPN